MPVVFVISALISGFTSPPPYPESFTPERTSVFSAATVPSTSGSMAAVTSWPMLGLSHASDILAATYYMSITESGKTESARLVLTVEAYQVQASQAFAGTVSITGTARMKETLTADTSGLTNAAGTLHYPVEDFHPKSLYSVIDIGADSATYTLTEDELGKYIHVAVTFSGNSGNVDVWTDASVTAAIVEFDLEGSLDTLEGNGTSAVP